EGAVDRARLPPAEAALCEVLAQRPMTLAELESATSLPRERVELLTYLLVIAKCVESVSGGRVHPSTGALPIPSPSATHRVPSIPGISAARTPAPSTIPSH